MVELALIFVCLAMFSMKGAYCSQTIDFEEASVLAATLETTIELTIAMKKLSGFAVFARPMCVIYTRPQEGQIWRRYHETERLSKTNNPVFRTKIRLPYLLKDKQVLKFEVFDEHVIEYESYDSTELSYRGYATCKTADLLSAGGRLKLALKSRSGGSKFTFGSGKGYVVVYAEKLKNPYDLVTMKLRSENVVSKKICGGPEHYIEIYKRIQLEEEAAKGTEDDLMVYRTEAKDDELFSKDWYKFSIPFSTLCDNDRKAELKFVCLRRNNPIGEFKTTIREIETSKAQFPVKNKKKKVVGDIFIYDVSINYVLPFAEFIAAGLRLRLTIAIDFSRRKYLIESPKSFHYQKAGENKCEKAIRLVVTAFRDLIWNNRYDIRGFGAEKHVGDMFPLDDFPLYKDDSDKSEGVEGLEGTLQAYRDAFHDTSIRMGGEGKIAPAIYRLVDNSKSRVPSGTEYFVLVVLTAGEILTGSRMTSVLEHVGTVNYVPLSIVFLGIGDVDLSNLKETFANQSTRLYQQSSFITIPESELESDTGSHYAYRKTEILEALPKQVALYMNRHGIKPGSEKKSLF